MPAHWELQETEPNMATFYEWFDHGDGTRSIAGIFELWCYYAGA
jgi:hypothetical protein